MIHSNVRRVLLLVQEAIHIVSGARMKSVLLLFQASAVGEDVVALGFLPQVVELYQLSDRARPHLLLLDQVEVLSEYAQARLEVAALLLRPERDCVAWRDVADFPPSQCFFNVVPAL